ncbi:hypothetical protein BJV78DRAFT_1220121 [Lactifluus subvellereus]|nr:hypothetical protein BJV78DRAFT_1220121 [Lactifluus subvellereus]
MEGSIFHDNLPTYRPPLIFNSSKDAVPERAVLASLINRNLEGSYVLTVPSLSEEDRPPKRPRVNLAKNRSNTKGVLSKRSRGCLSELPTMPLDILYEIFGHLPPADLLSLSRVNKAFRLVLISRRSSFLWNASLNLCGAPHCPEDMSPPAWAHLLFGGTYCYSCGAQRVTKILFSLRRRACKSCLADHLHCTLTVPQEYGDMIRFDTGYTRSTIHPPRSPCIRHWWDEDVKAFRAELDALKRTSCNPDSVLADTETSVSEFLARKKKEVADIQEHVLICLKWERSRDADRNTVLSDVRDKRFEDIKARFLRLGYQEEDVKMVRWHREVRISKPMSDRVWQRVEPLLRPGVNDARHKRLIRDGGVSYRQGRDVVVTQYGNFLKTLRPLPLALTPTAIEFLCENQALADAVASGSTTDGPELRVRISEAISKLEQELETRKLERTTLLRTLLPNTGASEHATDEEALGLATSIYECSDCRLPVSGLHMLAHDCDRAQKPKSLHAQSSERGRETVEALLQLLGLGKETTALELDRRNDRFVCMGCPRASFFQNGVDVLGRCVRDWRSCIAHAIGARKERWHKSNPTWLLVGTAKTAGVSGDEFPSDHAYGCLRCPVRIEPNSGAVRWYRKVGAIKEHVQKEHGTHEPMEGEDFYFNYGSSRPGCRSLLAMDR